MAAKFVAYVRAPVLSQIKLEWEGFDAYDVEPPAIPDVFAERPVDAHVKNIRANLRAIRPDMDPIVTHRGVGYSLREDS